MLKFKDGDWYLKVLDHAFLVLPYAGRDAYVYEFKDGEMISKIVPAPKHDVPRIIGCQEDHTKSECPNIEDLKSLCSDLLKGMDKCSEAPYYIIQPFLSIIKKHKDTIKKYNID